MRGKVVYAACVMLVVLATMSCESVDGSAVGSLSQAALDGTNTMNAHQASGAVNVMNGLNSLNAANAANAMNANNGLAAMDALTNLIATWPWSDFLSARNGVSWIRNLHEGLCSGKASLLGIKDGVDVCGHALVNHQAKVVVETNATSTPVKATMKFIDVIDMPFEHLFKVNILEYPTSVICDVDVASGIVIIRPNFTLCP